VLTRLVEKGPRRVQIFELHNKCTQPSSTFQNPFLFFHSSLRSCETFVNKTTSLPELNQLSCLDVHTHITMRCLTKMASLNHLPLGLSTEKTNELRKRKNKQLAKKSRQLMNQQSYDVHFRKQATKAKKTRNAKVSRVTVLFT